MEKKEESWLTHQPLLNKLVLAFALVFLCFLATSAFTFMTFARNAEIRGQESHQIRVIREAQKAGQALRMQQINVRNYLLSGDQQWLERMQDARILRDDSLDKALQLSTDTPAQKAQLAMSQADDWDRDLQQVFNDAKFNAALTPEAQLERNRAYVERRSSTAAAMIETLDSLYREQMDDFTEGRERVDRWVEGARTVTVVLLVLGLLIVLLALWLASRQIVRPIHLLARQMTLLAEGDTDISVPGQARRDEIGSISRALNVFRINSVASNNANWVKISAGEVTAALQNTNSSDDYVKALVSEMTPRLGAGVGVFFKWDESLQQLQLKGSYGFQHRKHLGIHYQLGEALIGQAALERKRIVLEQVPENFFGIHSALGEAPPNHVMAIPLLLNEKLLGVFEFGTFGRFSSVQEAFIEHLLPAAALGLENNHRSEQTTLLLQQTQVQALELQRSEEELRAHDEELRATNDELQAKTVELEEQAQRLSASEEELRVQAEELQASNEELRQKTDTLNGQKKVLQDLQRDTEIKAEALARASQYKTDFLANMSHELRTPLNSLLILSNELADNESGHLDEEEVEAAQVIHDSGSNLLRLINDILDLSKIEAGKMDVYNEAVEVQSITREMLRHFRHVALENRLEFAIEVSDGLPATLNTDRSKLQQVLNNLLGNAFKFTREGTVLLRLTPADEATLQRCGASGEYVTIAVIDTGIGIPPERLASVFEAFEQVDSSTSRHYGGSGLGLAIARRLAQLLGGFLLADSVVDQGSTFALILPLEPLPIAGSSNEEPAQIIAPSSTLSLTSTAPAARVIDWIPDDRNVIVPGDTVILTIEDDPAFARILVDMIRRKSHRALAAADGESGLELARRYRPTGILLDVMLPGMDGWSVLEHIKRDPLTRLIPVHFISAVDEAAKGVALGAVGFLTKPVDRKSLTAAFDHLLDTAGKIVRRILLVDDDDGSRLALTHLLQADNVQIDEVRSGEEAMVLLASESYDCIVLDLNMDGMSGIDFLEAASAKHVIPPVVIYSGRDLSREENLKLRQYTDSIVIKGQRSPERLLDEVSLFLHSIRSGAGATQETDSDLAGRTVLVVDDDMRNIFALSKSLRARGLNVLMAQDGYKALRQLEENPGIELVLMDIMMPGMDGYETTREIRKLLTWAKLPIIAVTAKAMHGDRDKCLEAGANDYLAKPVDIDKLSSMMRVWLQK